MMRFNLIKFAIENVGRTPLGQRAYIENMNGPRNVMVSGSFSFGDKEFKMPRLMVVSNAKLNHYRYNWKLGIAERVS